MSKSTRLTVCLASLICASVLTQAGEENPVRIITDAGQPLASIFDGRTPNQQARDALVLNRTAAAALPNLKGPNIAKIMGLPAGNASSCPTGGICAQPGTTEGTSHFCSDSDGCGETVFDQDSTGDSCQGTLELYFCEQCCVSWVTCNLCGGSPPNLCPPGDHQPLQDGGCNPSPIIIDAQAEGFHLTSPANGVSFDITGDGHPLQVAWTDAHYHNAFLALPGADGLVHTGKELFGNFTPQPPSEHPNGFIALAQYDKPENGGNGDGIIDDRDEVFSKLRLWIDENHDGVCQPNELHRLPELGVYSLALNYTESPRTDEWGNQFRYKAQVNPGNRKDLRDQTPTGEPGRWTYDVFFVVK